LRASSMSSESVRLENEAVPEAGLTFADRGVTDTGTEVRSVLLPALANRTPSRRGEPVRTRSPDADSVASAENHPDAPGENAKKNIATTAKGHLIAQQPPGTRERWNSTVRDA
jgi:hypothetical protein